MQRNMKTLRTIHWIATGLISALLLMSSFMYIYKTDDVAKVFETLQFPTWLIYPMAIAKFAGVVMLITKLDKAITEWAYAGIFFNLLLAIGAHVGVDDGEWGGALVGLVLLLTSYFTWKKMPEKK